MQDIDWHYKKKKVSIIFHAAATKLLMNEISKGVGNTCNENWKDLQDRKENKKHITKTSCKIQLF